MPARQLSPIVWLVGSGTDESAYTDRHDCHCYLIWNGTGGLLIDAGTGLGADRWLANVREVCDPDRLDGVLLTHYHADHAGGAAAARNAGLRVLASPRTVRALADADELRTSLARAREVGVYPADYRLTPTTAEPVSRTGNDAILLADKGVRLRVIDAPGHCDGHVVALLDDGWRDWLLWARVCLEHGDPAQADGVRQTIEMLEADQGEFLSFAQVTARARD